MGTCLFSPHIRNLLCRIRQEELLILRLTRDMYLLSTFVLVVRRFLKILITFLLLKLFKLRLMTSFNLKKNSEGMIRLSPKRFLTALYFNPMRLKITLLQPSMMTFHKLNPKMKSNELLKRNELSCWKRSLKSIWNRKKLDFDRSLIKSQQILHQHFQIQIRNQEKRNI